MMTLIRHQPWFFINRWHPDFDRLFGESLGGRPMTRRGRRRSMFTRKTTGSC